MLSYNWVRVTYCKHRKNGAGAGNRFSGERNFEISDNLEKTFKILGLWNSILAGLNFDYFRWYFWFLNIRELPDNPFTDPFPKYCVTLLIHLSVCEGDVLEVLTHAAWVILVFAISRSGFGINSFNTCSSVAKTVRKMPRVDQKQVFIDTSMDQIALLLTFELTYSSNACGMHISIRWRV